MLDAVLAAGIDWGKLGNDVFLIGTSVLMLFLILGFWNWLMKNLGTF